MLLPGGYDLQTVNDMKNKDLATQSSNYYSVTTIQPAKIDPSDVVYPWVTSSGILKYMLLPANYSVVKRNDIIAKDSNEYRYYTMYSTQPAQKTDTDIIKQANHQTYGTVYMLVPQYYDDQKVQDGFKGLDVPQV